MGMFGDMKGGMTYRITSISLWQIGKRQKQITQVLWRGRDTACEH